MSDSPKFTRRTPSEAAAFRERVTAHPESHFLVHHGCRAYRTSANRWKIFIYGAEVHEAPDRLAAIRWIDENGPDFDASASQ